MQHSRDRGVTAEGGTRRVWGMALLGVLLGLVLLALGLLGAGGGGTAHASAPVCPLPGAVPPACLPPGPPPPGDPSPLVPGELVVTKIVVGGPAAASAFGFTVTVGAAPVSGQQSPGADRTTTFILGFNAVVTVEETATQPNYEVDNADCTNCAGVLGIDGDVHDHEHVRAATATGVADDRESDDGGLDGGL